MSPTELSLWYRAVMTAWHRKDMDMKDWNEHEDFFWAWMHEITAEFVKRGIPL